MVRAEVVLVVTVSLMRVLRVELGVQVRLEDVGVVGDTEVVLLGQEVEVEVEIEGVDYD